MRRAYLLSLALFSPLFAIDFSKEAKVNLELRLIKAVYHNFKADKSFPGGGDKFGNELDVIYKRKIFKNLLFGAKAALYDADSEAKNAGLGDRDVTKYWVWVTYKWSR